MFSMSHHHLFSCVQIPWRKQCCGELFRINSTVCEVWSGLDLSMSCGISLAIIMNNKLIFNFVSWKDIFCKLLSHEFCSCVFGSVNLNILLSQLSVAYVSLLRYSILISGFLISINWFVRNLQSSFTTEHHIWLVFLLQAFIRNASSLPVWRQWLQRYLIRICCLYIACFMLASSCNWGLHLFLYLAPGRQL